MDGGLEDVAMQAAETLQTAHINHNPTRADLAPDTSVDKKMAVEFDPSSGDVDSMAGEVDEDEVPLSILRPLPEDNRHAPRHLQLPDLRFEQSYLKSIENAENWGVVAYITLKDQVLMPLVQGLAWSLIVAGWRFSNASAKFSGQSIGAKVRRWWWGVNNWKIPDTPSKWSPRSER